MSSHDEVLGPSQRTIRCAVAREERIAFQHQSEVRQIIYGEFELEMAIEILRWAQRELDAVMLDDEEFDAASWNYCRDLRRAERFTIYGTVED